jgi:hypothetical protein
MPGVKQQRQMPSASHDNKSFSQRRFKRVMEITQVKLLSSWMPFRRRGFCSSLGQALSAIRRDGRE